MYIKWSWLIESFENQTKMSGFHFFGFLFVGIGSLLYSDVFNCSCMEWGSEIQPFEIQTFWGSDFKWSEFSYGDSYSPKRLKTGQFNVFLQISNGFWKNGCCLIGFQMVGLPHFRFHSKSRIFPNQPLFDHSKPSLAQISDLHCNV